VGIRSFRSLILIVGVYACLSVVAPFALGQQPQNDPRFSETAVAEYNRREKLIIDEIATLKNHPWAGKYHYGDGLGVNVTLYLAPKNGFVFDWTGCLGVYDQNYGDVVWTGEGAKLLPQFPNDRRGFQGIGEELIPVRWGGLRYLIPADRMVDFCNSVNAKTEPPRKIVEENGETFFKYGRFLLRESAKNPNALGRPAIPQRFQEYLLVKPIRAVVTSVGEITLRKETQYSATNRSTRVTLSVGRSDGVRDGMEFHLQGINANGYGRVVESDEHSSVVILWQVYFEKELPAPAVGWKLSTLLSDY
jgi:hypothetical protein